MDRYDWDWNRGYDRPWFGRRYGRDFDRPRAWEGYGEPGPQGWPWRGDEFGGGYGWRSRGSGEWGRPRGAWYGPEGRQGGGGYGGRYGSPHRGGYGGYGMRPGGAGGGYGWGGGYDRFRDPFRPGGSEGYASGFVESFEIDEFDDEFDDVFEDAEDENDLDWAMEGSGAWGGEPDDPEIRRRVWQNLMDDGFVDAKAIQIDVDDRVVTLRGEVGDYMEARYVWDDAWEAVGVRGVISKLTIRGEARQEAPADTTKKAGTAAPRKREAKKKDG